MTIAFHRSWVPAVAAVLVLVAPLRSQSTRPPAPAPAADDLVAAAVKQANAEGKMVFVDFAASWCAPCRQLEALFAEPSLREAWHTHFVFLRLTVFEHGNEALKNPGAERLMEKWGGSQSIPFYAILDRAGTLVAADGGYPSGMTDIPKFLTFVDRGAPALTASDRKRLETYLVATSDGLGSIAGRVTDGRGQGVAGALVSIVTPRWSHGAWQPAPGARATTDAAGRYVIEGVAAGSHAIVVSASGEPSRAVAFPPTFFPSALRRADARLVTVKRGEGLVNVGLTTAAAGAASLRGTVRSAGGSPAAGAIVTLTNVDWPATSFTGSAGADGSFSFSHVWPGRYSLVVMLGDSTPARARAEVGLLGVRLPAGAASTVEVVTTPRGALSGTVRFEGAPALTSTERAAIRVTAIPVDVPLGLPANALRSHVDADSRFRLDGLQGRSVIRVEGLPAGWMLSAVSRGGADDPDAALDIAGGVIGDVTVVVARQAGALAGRVVDDARRTVPRGAAIVFAADQDRWTYPSRFVRSAAIQADGTFRVLGLPPGEYLVARVASLTSAWDAPESLAPLRSGATAVAIAPGRSVTLTVRIAK